MNSNNLLNAEQKEAVSTVEGPLLVIAGAGSGKTRVVTFRIVHLIEQGVLPTRILALTFTNKAAGEMQERIKKLTHTHVLICTFHSLGARILRESIPPLGFSRDFTIYDEDDSENLLKICLQELEIAASKDNVKGFKQMISRAKNAILSPDNIDTADLRGGEREFPKVYALYQTKLKTYNAVDFDDLLYLSIRLFREHPSSLQLYQERWSHLLVDEYQDTNAAQYELVRYLVGKHQNICVVGDPDQSIYSWRGAQINNILNFGNDFPNAKIIRLEQNYRSRSNILEAANALICRNDSRYEKNLWSSLGKGESIKYFSADTEQREAEFIAEQIRIHRKQHDIPLKDMVIFYRTNSQSRIFEDVLLSKRIPYVVVGGISFYQRREVKDILAFLKIVSSGTDYVAFARTINIPKRGFGETTIDKIRQGANQEGLSIMAYCEALVKNSPLENPLKLSTKQQKGLADYLNIIYKLKHLAKEGAIRYLVLATIEQTDYLNYLKEDRETFEDRKGNLDALVNKAAEWELAREHLSLSAFLEELSLKTTLDEAQTTEDRLNLMTIHNGKGLEFAVTFLAGLEEDLFPHINAKSSSAAMEEERRLCYVGITRAKEFLYLTNAKSRLMWGTRREQQASRFLRELPQELITKIRSLVHFAEAETALPSHSMPESLYSQGDTVFHKEFGIGVVREVSHSALGPIYKIFFSKEHALKSIVGNYAHLTKL